VTNEGVLEFVLKATSVEFFFSKSENFFSKGLISLSNADKYNHPFRKRERVRFCSTIYKDMKDTNHKHEGHKLIRRQIRTFLI
jgi:mRNA deadenylase 3'-5' endonuclease subunit Ccr4